MILVPAGYVLNCHGPGVCCASQAASVWGWFGMGVYLVADLGDCLAQRALTAAVACLVVRALALPVPALPPRDPDSQAKCDLGTRLLQIGHFIFLAANSTKPTAHAPS